jgi:hypothetical protein
MRRLALVGSLLLGLTGCSLTLDPNSVPPPVVPGGCTPLCAGRTCGVSDGCSGTCEVSNSTCTPPTTTGVKVERGGLSLGAAHASGTAHQVQGQLGLGSTNQAMQGLTFQVQQGTLR